MTLKGMIIITGCALSLNSIAGTMGPIQPDIYLGAPLPWMVIGSLGILIIKIYRIVMAKQHLVDSPLLRSFSVPVIRVLV